MANCLHDYKYGEDATSTTELLERITQAGEKGLWIKKGETDLVKELVSQNKVKLCSFCDRAAYLV